MHGLFITSGSQHVDNQTLVEHAAPHCSSRELYKGVLGGRSRGVFRGRVIVRPGAQKTDAKQINHNLLVSDEPAGHQAAARDLRRRRQVHPRRDFDRPARCGGALLSARALRAEPRRARPATQARYTAAFASRKQQKVTRTGTSFATSHAPTSRTAIFVAASDRDSRRRRSRSPGTRCVCDRFCARPARSDSRVARGEQRRPRRAPRRARPGRRCGSRSAPAGRSRAVIRASPVGQPPIVRHSSSSSGPAARWIAPSTPPPPSSDSFAALTIASTASVVMSAVTTSMRRRISCTAEFLALEHDFVADARPAGRSMRRVDADVLVGLAHDRAHQGRVLRQIVERVRDHHAARARHARRELEPRRCAARGRPSRLGEIRRRRRA